VAQGLGRVLVVDDDEVIRQLIAVNLTLEGFDVATAVDGQDCLDKGTAIDDRSRRHQDAEAGRLDDR
jgi:DNA-binding response OmpR family regulator